MKNFILDCKEKIIIVNSLDVSPCADGHQDIWKQQMNLF